MILHGIEYQRPTSLNMRILANHVTYSFLAFMKSIFHFCLGCYCGGYSQNGRSNLSSCNLQRSACKQKPVICVGIRWKHHFMSRRHHDAGRCSIFAARSSLCCSTVTIHRHKPYCKSYISRYGIAFLIWKLYNNKAYNAEKRGGWKTGRGQCPLREVGYQYYIQ